MDLIAQAAGEITLLGVMVAAGGGLAAVIKVLWSKVDGQFKKTEARLDLTELKLESTTLKLNDTVRAVEECEEDRKRLWHEVEKTKA